MSSYPILTALSLPAVSTFPSARCIQWTADGQAVLLSKNAIYILTPDSGIAVDKSSVVKQALDKAQTTGSQRPLGWLRTMIELGKANDMHAWAEENRDWWGAVSLGPTDFSFTAVACSPSNISADAGCIYALLDSNSEVFLFKPVKDPLIGQWVGLGDLHEILTETSKIFIPEDDAKKLHRRTLHQQTTDIAWSPPADFGMSPAPDIDGALLAIGNRAGYTHLMRYTQDLQTSMLLQRVASVRVGDRWITRLAWSAAICTRPGTSQTYLACALADGSVVVTEIAQTITATSDTAAFYPEYNLEVTVNKLEEEVFDGDQKSTTSLRWIDTSQPEPILVFTKPGVVYLWSKPSAFTPWSGLRAIRLERQKLSVGSTPFAMVSGVSYSPRSDALVVSLADGSFHVVQKVTTDPALAPGTAEDNLASASVSKTARAVFIKVEEDDVDRRQVNAIYGMTSYDGDSYYTWIHEGLRPTDFSYKHDAKHTSMLVTAQLWNGKNDDQVVQNISDILSRCRAASGESSLATLRHIFLELRDSERFRRLHPRVLALVRTEHFPDDSSAATLPAWTGPQSTALRAQFRRSLRAHLFGRNSFLSHRLCVMLAGFCEQESDDAAVREAFRAAAADTVGTLWPRLLRIVVRHIAAVLPLLAEPDVPFVLRIIVQALLPGTPDDLQAEAHELSARIQALVPATGVDAAALGLNEPCPACRAAVPLQDINTATCPNGHSWPRCSITSFVLSTPMVRTCMGCSRKAFLPPPARDTPWLPPAARSWLVEDLLNAVRRCFFCGAGFVTLL
ncbi:transcription factor IIIC subunit delta N-term-domain-containing protein [Phanerochaete sordida]|uniref:Transcription factor IIIC subunit delta N-term-domain-containing protein n=1 Tax=Phanerochaete sordida TaxID=48140 RepID=A0A9P3LAH1_9APHY|nr:transcription factor IIIC subunit delta N-term-domain-containing protein [Phanerochaete sordida]